MSRSMQSIGTLSILGRKSEVENCADEYALQCVMQRSNVEEEEGIRPGLTARISSKFIGRGRLLIQASTHRPKPHVVTLFRGAPS
jgi:hypothetical protein